MEEECAVCFCETAERTRPCHHPVCDACLQKWILRHHYTCPMCRQPVLGPDDDHATRTDRGSVVIDPSSGTFFGVTVRYTMSGRGVRVTRTVPRDLMHASGVRPGDILTHINGIPVNDPGIAILLLEGATNERVRVRLRTRRPILTAAAQGIRAAFARRFRRPSRSVVWTTARS